MAKKDKSQVEDHGEANGQDNGEVETVPTGTVLTWKDGDTSYTVDVANLPQAAIVALAQRGFTHVLGNEVASAISAKKKQVNEDGSYKFSDAELVSMAHDLRLSKIAAIEAGKLGVRAGAARLSGLAKVMRDIALEQIKAVAVAKGKSLPKATEDRNALIEARLAKYGDLIKAKAEARMAEMAEVIE